MYNQQPYGQPYGQYPQQQPYYDPRGQAGYPDAFGPEGSQDRGLGKKLLIAGAAIAAVAAVCVIGGVVYKKSRKKKTVQTKDGKTREIEVDVFVDESGRELPGQIFDEYGNLVNEQEILSRSQTAPGPQYGTPALPPPQQYPQQFPPQQQYPQCQQPPFNPYATPSCQPNFAPPPYVSQSSFNSAPYGTPYGAPPPNCVPPAQFAPPPQNYGSYGGPPPMNAASVIGSISPYPSGPY